MIFLKDFYILYIKSSNNQNKTDYKIPILDIIITIYIISYMSITLKIGFIMFFYFYFLKCISILLISNNYYWISKYLFIFGWLFQFIGHYIEGKRPSFIDSLTQSFYQAPLFSLESIIPDLI